MRERIVDAVLAVLQRGLERLLFGYEFCNEGTALSAVPFIDAAYAH